MDFTQEQEKIFEFVQSGVGHGIIDAVAGAGKTTTIMECAKYVPDKSDVLFCAFNKSIASEIADKFNQKGMQEVTTMTMHALGYQILKSKNSSGRLIEKRDDKYRNLLNSAEIQDQIRPYLKKIIKFYGYEFDEYGDRQSYQIENLSRTFSERLLDINQKYRLTLCKDSFAEFKNMILHYGIFNEVQSKSKYFDEELECYLESHRILLEAGNSLSRRLMIIDFSDMLYLPYVWKLYPNKKYGFVFVDECQDLSFSQLGIALKYGKRGGRILSVGDPRQSIYGFTGADINSFGNIKKYTNASNLPLTLCFRCPPNVIEIAKTIREDIVGKKEVDGIVQGIRLDEVVDMALPNDLIICRTKAPLLLLVFDFIEKERRVKIHPDIAKDLIDQLRRLFKKEELFKLIEIQFGGFEKLKDAVSSRREWVLKKEAERIFDADERRFYIETELSLLESKLNFLQKRYEIWQEECETLEDIFKKINEYVTEKNNPIVISTIHSAKGLEEKRVFIINYTDLPLTRPEQKDWEVVQEINLKYVAVTRAKEELYLVKSPKLNEIIDEGSLFDDLFENGT
ncbi:ATP-dependent helicase [Aequorivita sp. H23M31]|uniref:ATP-dependent helicase n=1 Tax=Aequorivita ciconiae TaxID=2494375 RepID=A0A410G5Q1_9FLAO|nr:UvrD-helicase domain-containing protein [Aequorivita sp. H23M31]QAA82607.1 ATP-dependent helicase [Aequorivita sp. H23M31]